MSANISGTCLSPSSSLPSIRQLLMSSEGQISSALRNLQTLYCPLRMPASLTKPTRIRRQVSAASTPGLVDSGYTSQDEKEDGDLAHEEMRAILLADPFERNFATRWLTALISRSEEMDLDEETRTRMIDDAAFILSSFSDCKKDEEEALTRDFSFPISNGTSVSVTLNDAPLSGTDHTDVGLQSWGASIVLSSMMCADPAQFGLTPAGLPTKPTFIELGAGTGLVSLTLAKLSPELGIHTASIVATDYHPAVLDNCNANVTTNFPSAHKNLHSVETSLLDWSRPPIERARTADLVIACDVVYAPEHSAWLRDCAAHLITPGGTFWLMVTVRKVGKFEGLPDTVEAAFEASLCPLDSAGRRFQISQKLWIDKRKGIGRGDESGYNLYRIGWA